MNYKVTFDKIRTSSKEGVRYAKVRAIANGPDSYNSIFTMRARQSLIDQLKQNGVKSGALHKNAIGKNVTTYLKSLYNKAVGKDKEDLTELLGQIPNADYPIGVVEDAYFVEDNIVEAVIRENDALKTMGAEEKGFLNSAWDMIGNGALSGVSLVFNDLVTTMSGEQLIIDDLNVQGLDFVDRPSHKDTRVVETFMRAIQDTTHLQEEPTKVRSSGETQMTNEPNNKEPTTPVVNVDDIVAQAEAKVEENAKAKAQAETEAKEKEDAIRKEYEDQLKAKDDEITKLTS